MTDLRALLSAATPPPWTHNTALMARGGTASRVEAGDLVVANARDADAALIVALVNQAHTLLDITEAAREACAHLGSQRPEIAALEAALARLDQTDAP